MKAHEYVIAEERLAMSPDLETSVRQRLHGRNKAEVQPDLGVASPSLLTGRRTCGESEQRRVRGMGCTISTFQPAITINLVSPACGNIRLPVNEAQSSFHLLHVMWVMVTDVKGNRRPEMRWQVALP